ncbi:MAG TPA: alpha/beta fold hydrolase [Planctomycetota bacterium]
MRRLTLLFLSVVFALLLPAQQAEPQPEPDASPPLRQFTVPLHDGQLKVDELVQALFAEYELDGDALRVPEVRIDLRGAQGYLLLFASRKLLLDTVRFRRDFAQSQLLVAIDRERAREVRRQLRARLAKFAGRLAGEEVAERNYELVLPDEVDEARPLCVLVHGVENDAGMWADLRSFLEAEPRRAQVATFSYPNDESIERVAAELAAKLRGLGAQPIALIGHSMGGLVARAVVEDPALDPGNVRTLILTGVPNAGSNLAGLRFALEVADVVRDAGAERFARELLAIVADHWRDGLGEAGGDLFPGSVCLGKMARRGRNPRVAYHLVLGTRSVLSEKQLAGVQEVVKASLAESGFTKVVRPRLERWLDDLDELVDGKGDGAVSVARGRLEGVEPVLVPLDHLGLVRRRGLLGRIEKGEDHPVFVRIAKWVEAPGKGLVR